MSVPTMFSLKEISVAVVMVFLFAGASLEKPVMIRLQAENGGRTGIWFVKETGGGKRQYIETTEDNAGLTYNVALPAAGSYYLWINGGVRRNTSVYTVKFDARTN